MKSKILSLIFVASLFSACSDYLDTDVNAYLTEDRKEELIATSPTATALLIKANLSGVYDVLVSFTFDNNTSHDAFGLKSIDLALDLTGDDMVQDVHHHFGFDYNIDNRGATYRRTNRMWALFYKVISSSNTMLQDYFSEEVVDKDLLALKSEILTLRGFSYFYLVNLYQHTYVGNEKSLGVPILLSPDDESKPRASVEDVYKQIIEDLEFALENGYATDEKGDADRSVAAAYLAKAYAHMNLWDKVEEVSQIAYREFSISPENQNGKLDNGDNIWGYDINAQTTTLYASFYSHIDNTIQGYAGMLGITKSIHSVLYNKLSETDSRKKLYISEELFPTIAEKYGLKDYCNVKFVTKDDFSGDYVFIRSADPYLLYVESLVEQNKLDDAREALLKFVGERDGSYDVDLFDSQEKLREEVRFQRRIELWGEGSSFFDIKRWKVGINRDVPGTNHRVKVNYPDGDKVLIYQIPQREIDANPLIVQNP